MVIKKAKGKQKMVMQGVLKLLKSLIPLSLSSPRMPFSLPFPCFGGFLVPHVPLGGGFF